MKHLDLINIRQGTQSSARLSNGNTVAAVQLPFAMAGFSLQTASDRGNWFYHPQDKCLEGIRLTHQPSPWIGDYGCFCFLPQEGDRVFADPGHRWSGYRPERAVLRPEYLSVEFLRYGAFLELTPTERGAAIRIRYQGDGRPRFSVLPVKGECGYRLDAANRLLTGYTRAHSWPVHESFAAYFAIRFDCDLEESACRLMRADNTAEYVTAGHGEGLGYSVALTRKNVNIQMAISYISEEQARENLRQDQEGQDFEMLRRQAEEKWESLLSRIEIETPDTERMKTFYSCLYRMFLYPHTFHEVDREGRTIHYCPHDGHIAEGVMYVDNGFWDTFRTVYPLYAILIPEKYDELLRGFVQIYRDTGWLPKWPSPGEVGMMPGTLIDAVIAHAAVTGSAGRDVLEEAFAGMLKHASESSNDKRYGRHGSRDYAALGYIPRDKYRESVNHTLDYVYGDFCIAQTARVLGQVETAERFMKSAGHYRLLFDPQTGFMRGRDAEGKRAEDFDPLAWGGEYCEGGPWQNSFAVYHDPEGLAALYGGKERLCAKLDELFALPPQYHIGGYGGEIHEMTEMATVDFGQCAISNQPSFHIPYLYAALGRRDKTAYWVKKLAEEAFGSRDDGFPGDEDNGSMAGWYLFSCMGFYPLCPGKAEYVKGIRLVDRLVINGREVDADAFPGDVVRHADLFPQG